MAVFGIIALSILAYSPTLSIPLIEDDFPNIVQSQEFAKLGPLAPLHDSVFRFRTTSYWILAIVGPRLGEPPNQSVCHCVSLGIHALNSLLLLWIGLRWSRSPRMSIWLACFFAVHEGHQEAVMWYSAINELLQFAFGAAALLLWRNVEESIGTLNRAVNYLGALSLFSLSILSKESAIVLLPLFFVSWRRPIGINFRAAPFALVAFAAVLAIKLSQAESFRFLDGSFSLDAPILLTILRSEMRLFWFWGALALLYILRSGAWVTLKTQVALSVAGITLFLVPYSFLTYMDRVPSRQTYLASACLAFLVALGFEELVRRSRSVAVPLILASIAIAHNVGYVWMVKREQFLERARPTERVISFCPVSGPTDSHSMFSSPSDHREGRDSIDSWWSTVRCVVGRRVEPF